MSWLAAVLLLASLPLPAEEREPEAARSASGVTLVLSGGGARGAAHIGALKVLEELRVPVDLVVGTSIGAIVGGLYAAGWSPSELETLLVTKSFNGLFVDHPERDDKTFRRKQDDRDFLVPLKLRFRGWKPYLPPAALGGQRLETLLRTLEIDSTDARDFDDLPIPFRAVATDLATGEAVVIGEGSLATALRASMSIAGVFPPVTVDGRWLVDGGASANLPVGIAQKLGAGRIVAVDNTSPLRPAEELGALLSVYDQFTTFLTMRNLTEDLARLHRDDLVITPDLGDLWYSDFDRIPEAISLGEAAARQHLEALKAFSVSEEAYAQFQARHHKRPIEEVIPEAIRIENSSWVNDAIVRRAITTPLGVPLDLAELRTEAMRLSALEYFGTLRHSYEKLDSGGVLVVGTPAKPYGRNSLQFGVNFNDDFRGEAGYALSVRHQRLAANRRGGEWQNIGQIGDRSLFSSEFYQPLDAAMAWFVVPAVEVRRYPAFVWLDGEVTSEYRISSNEGRFAAGRVLGRWGELRAGLFRSSNRAEVRIGPQVLPEFRESDCGMRFTFRVDTRDAAAFPQRGLELEARLERTLESLGAEREYGLRSLRASLAVTRGKNTVVPGIEAGSLYDGDATVQNVFSLGGLLRLSGFGTDELSGPRIGLVNLIYYRELTGFDLGSLSPRLYAGISLEAGNTFADGEAVAWGTLRRSAGVFIGGRTPLGPIYLAYARAGEGRQHVYFNIGTRF